MKSPAMFLSSATIVTVLALLACGFWLKSNGSNRWLWVILLVLQAHFAASYIAPTEAHLGLFNFIWPWVAGDRGLFGVHPNILGIALGGIAGMVSILSALAVLGIWLPHHLWPGLATLGAGLEIVLMIGFFGPTKLLPIALDAAVLAALVMNWFPIKAAV